MDTQRYNLNCPRLSADCRKCWNAERTAWMTPTCYASPCGIPSFVELERTGTDSHGRPTYRTNNGIALCDVSMGEMKLCTLTEAGEPDSPLDFKHVTVKN